MGYINEHPIASLDTPELCSFRNTDDRWVQTTYAMHQFGYFDILSRFHQSRVTSCNPCP